MCIHLVAARIPNTTDILPIGNLNLFVLQRALTGAVGVGILPEVAPKFDVKKFVGVVLVDVLRTIELPPPPAPPATL